MLDEWRSNSEDLKGISAWYISKMQYLRRYFDSYRNLSNFDLNPFGVVTLGFEYEYPMVGLFYRKIVTGFSCRTDGIVLFPNAEISLISLPKRGRSGLGFMEVPYFVNGVNYGAAEDTIYSGDITQHGSKELLKNYLMLGSYPSVSCLTPILEDVFSQDTELVSNSLDALQFSTDYYFE